MSVEQNKTIVRRIFDEVWGKGQVALLAQLYTTDVCDHLPLPGQPRGVEGQRWFVEMMRRAIPDMHITLDRVVGEGDFVTDYWTCTGTHKGEMMGMPATNKKFTISGSSMSRFSGGKISEIWALGDMLGMLQQLGLAPIPKGMPQEAGRRPTGTKTSGEAGRGSSTPDQRRDTIRRAYQEFIDRRNLTSLDQFLTPDYVGHFSAYPTVYGQEEFKKFVGMYNQGFPNMPRERRADPRRRRLCCLPGEFHRPAYRQPGRTWADQQAGQQPVDQSVPLRGRPGQRAVGHQRRYDPDAAVGGYSRYRPSPGGALLTSKGQRRR